MKRGFIVRFFLMLMVASESFGQSPLRNSNTIAARILPRSFTHYGAGVWGMGGSTAAIRGTPSAAMNNPAAAAYDKYAAYLEFCQNSSSEYFFNFKLNGQLIVPNYASFGFGFKNNALSFGYVNSYYLRLRDVPASGSYVDFDQRVKVDTYFASLRFGLSDAVSMGLTSGLNRLHQSDRIYVYSHEGTGIGFIIIMGLLYKPMPKLSLGGTVKYVSDIRYDIDLDITGSLVDFDSATSGPATTYPVDDMLHYRARFPTEFTAGFSYFLSGSTILASDVKMKSWRQDEFDDQVVVDIHVGLAFSASKRVGIYAGFFTKGEIHQIFYDYKYIDQKFLTLGMNCRITDRISCTASLLDSQFFDNSDRYEDINQTIILAGFKYGL